MKKLVIFGADILGELAHFYFTRDAGRSVAGFCVDGAYLGATSFHGLPVTSFEEAASAFPPAEHDLFVAIGNTDLNRARANKLLEAKAKGYAIASYCSSKADFMPDAPLEENCFITEGATVQPFVQIGRNAILFATRVGHHAAIGDDCYLGAAEVGSQTRIGTGCFIGNNATVVPGVAVGERCVIGAGAVVPRDLPPYSVVAAPRSRHSPVPSHRLRRV